MSTNKSGSMTYKYQSKTKNTRASAPIVVKNASTTQIKPGRFSTYKPSVSSKMTEDLSAYYLYDYIFQDMPDETNTVFFDSNLRKYRTRSSAKARPVPTLSKSYNSQTNFNALKKDSKYSVNKNTYSLKESKGIGLNENKNINILKERKKENAQIKIAAKGSRINDNKGIIDSEKRAEIIRQLKKEKDELLGTNSSNYSSSKKRGEKPQEEKSISNQNKKSNLNINTDKTPKQLGNANINIKNLKGSNTNKIQDEQTKNQKSPMTKDDKKLEVSKLNKTSQQQEKQNDTKKSLTKADTTQKLGTSSTKSKQTIQPQQAKPNLSQTSPVQNAQLEGSKQLNTSQQQAKQKIDQKIPRKETIAQKNPLKQSPNKEDSISTPKKIEDNNQNISEDNKKSSGFMKKDIPQSLKSNQYQNEYDTYENNMKRNENEPLRESNVSVVKKQNEKTLLLVPGQTIEPKSIIETFENPVEEIIQNPDGTTTSLIKQTKIITTTENVPIEENKIKSLEGAPGLPMVKQYITYEYKTVTTVKENEEQGLDGPNQLSSFNLMNQSSSPMKFGQKGINQQEDNYNSGNLNDQKNINSNSQFGNEKLGENADFNNNENKLDNENVKSNFTPDILPKGFKSEEEVENFLDKINQKGEDASPEEKEKRLKCIEDIFNNISKGGENTEENLQKLSKLLSNINGKERLEILAKLGKDFPKSEELFKKLTNLVQNKLNKSIKFSEGGEVKGVAQLKFEGLFLEISKYNNEHREKNPFEGPSPYCKFYKDRKIKIKQKIHDMASGEIENNDNEK